ncbi:MAG: ArsA family ATPase [Dehalococcoidales bacterium]|nr:ArsA family ATPase [Dehalococcoidales bacterium]
MVESNGSIYMFSGKGGVGKTTCAATTALHHASLGEKTLALSTDATPSLAHIFEIKGGQKPAEVTESLFIDEIGIPEVEEMWDRKFGREVYEVFSSIVSLDYDSFKEFMSSMLPGLADEFMVDYIRQLKLSGKYESIIWDTAPLGQTLALLHTPSMLIEHLKLAPRIYTNFKFGQRQKSSIMEIIKSWQKLSGDCLDFLRREVRFTIVTIPEALAFEQLDGVFKEMEKNGFKIGQLVVNNVIKSDESEFLKSKASQQKRYLDMIYERFSKADIIELAMRPYEIKGVERLKEIEKSLFQQAD